MRRREKFYGGIWACPKPNQNKTDKKGFSKQITWSIFPPIFNTSKTISFLDYLSCKHMLNNAFDLGFRTQQKLFEIHNSTASTCTFSNVQVSG